MSEELLELVNRYYQWITSLAVCGSAISVTLTA
jgi:hypothetical protein